MINVGIDWAEDAHQVCLLDVDGITLDEFIIRDGVTGTGHLHERIAHHVDEPEQVVIGIETDRGLLVGALVAAGYQVYAINPMSVDRYATDTRHPAASLTAATRRCWPIWSVRIGTTTAPLRPTASCWPRSRSLPAPTRT